jgi:hypothetical protein
MFTVLLLSGGLVLGSLFYAYAAKVDKSRSGDRLVKQKRPGRDMWTATLLDCDFEPAKVRFGPAKAIPAGGAVHHADHKDEFSRHMSTK